MLLHASTPKPQKDNIMTTLDQPNNTLDGYSPKPLYQSAITVAVATLILLLFPLIAMQFTAEVNWTLADFIVAFILFFGTGFTYKLVTRSSSNISYRIAVGFTVLSALLLVWVNLAVGIVGAEDNPFNVLYFGVLFVGIIGSLFVRFQPKGMIYVLGFAALVIVGITIVAFIQGFHQAPNGSVYQLLGVNAFFIMLILICVVTFYHASKNRPLIP